MANNESSPAPRPPSAPPSYEQSLRHPRIEESNYQIPDYPLDGAYPGPPRGRPNRIRSGRPRSGFIRGLPIHGNRHISRSISPAVVTDDDVVSNISEPDENTKTCLKMSLPPMHMCMAITCLVLNILIPGLGTILAGWGIFCCTRADRWLPREKFLGCGLNFLIGLAQLALVPVVLIGWIWSVIWGFALLGVSLDNYHGMKDYDEEEAASHEPQAHLPPYQEHVNSPTSVSQPQSTEAVSEQSCTTETDTTENQHVTEPVVHPPPYIAHSQPENSEVHAQNDNVNTGVTHSEPFGGNLQTVGCQNSPDGSQDLTDVAM